MRKLYFTCITLLIGLTFILSACSKNDDAIPDSDINKLEFKEVYQYEAVIVKSSKLLTKDIYEGNVNNKKIDLHRIAETELMFLVPEDIPFNTDFILEVKELEFKLKIRVNETKLVADKKVVIDGYLEHAESEIINLSDENNAKLQTIGVLKEFKEKYKNLSNQEQIDLAKVIQANSMLLMFNTVNEFNPMNVNEDVFYLAQAAFNFELNNYKLAVFGIGVGVAMIFSPIAIVPLIGALVLYKSICVAIESHSEFSKKKLKKSLDPFQDMNRNGLNAMMLEESKVFVNDKTGSLSITMYSKTLGEEDQSSTNENVQFFFTYYSLLKERIAEYNGIVNWIMEQTFFSNLNTIENVNLSRNASLSSDLLTSEEFDKMRFSVDNSNVELKEVNYESGRISMKMIVKNAEDLTTKSIQTSLKYTYKDDYNSINAVLPIEIILKDENSFKLEGNWKFTIIVLYGNGENEITDGYFTTDESGASTYVAIEDVVSVELYYSSKQNKLQFKAKMIDGKNAILHFPVSNINQNTFDLPYDEDFHYRLTRL